jgi:recombination protein RecR
MFNQADAINNLIKRLTKLPGMGKRSAQRVALHLLADKDKNIQPLLHDLQNAFDKVENCTLCGNLDTQSPCTICTDTRRTHNIICLVQTVGDIWSVERTGIFKGHYHVLGGVLSALDGVGPTQLRIQSLLKRLDPVDEIIIALGATVDGQATAHYIAEQIRKIKPDIQLTRLAYGVPIGGEVEHLDESTLLTAMKSRGTFGS